jgi:hypothetical protein
VLPFAMTRSIVRQVLLRKDEPHKAIFACGLEADKSDCEGRLATDLPRLATFDSRLATELVRPEGLEPPAYRFEACRSIQLSYGRGQATSVVHTRRDGKAAVLKSWFPRA